MIFSENSISYKKKSTTCHSAQNKKSVNFLQTISKKLFFNPLYTQESVFVTDVTSATLD